MLRILAVLTLLLPGLARAESFPTWENTYVNDYAEVLDAETEARVRTLVQTLREQSGVEMTVLTLYTRETYAPGSRLEDFATGLFNTWGIGNAQRNDGILMLILTQDRDMRIELGAGYGKDYDIAAEYVIQLDMLPHFKEGDFNTGTLTGTQRVIEWIAEPFAEDRAPPQEALDRAPSGGGGGAGGVIKTLVGGFVALLFGSLFFGRRIGNSLRRCPNCGQRGVDKTTRTLVAATRMSTGEGEKTLRCRHCDFTDVSPFIIPKITRGSSSSSGGSGGGFGGGRSSGGGASGSW